MGTPSTARTFAKRENYDSSPSPSPRPSRCAYAARSPVTIAGCQLPSTCWLRTTKVTGITRGLFVAPEALHSMFVVYEPGAIPSSSKALELNYHSISVSLTDNLCDMQHLIH